MSDFSEHEDDFRDLLREVQAEGLLSDAFLSERGLEIPHLALDERLPKGEGTGTRLLTRLIGFADERGMDVLVAPDLGRSMGLYRRLGFVWPAEETVCEDTDLLMMVREATPAPAPSP